MSLSSHFSVTPKAILLCRILGLCVFAAAFFLPACQDAAPGIIKGITFKGWECASIALSASFEMDSYQSPGFLAAMSGWINPLILAFLLFTFWPKFVRLRRSLAVAILVCMAATWVFFSMQHIRPLIGHVLWIAGALIMLLPEVAGQPEKVPSAARQPLKS